MKWNEVTWYSKLTALILFVIILPIWAFYLGTQYELTRSSLVQVPIVSLAEPKNDSQINSTSTLSWNTYTDITGQISFQYPQNWIVQANHSEKVASDLTDIEIIPSDGNASATIYSGGLRTKGWVYNCDDVYTKESLVTKCVQKDPVNPFSILYTKSNSEDVIDTMLKIDASMSGELLKG